MPHTYLGYNNPYAQASLVTYLLAEEGMSVKDIQELDKLPEEKTKEIGKRYRSFIKVPYKNADGIEENGRSLGGVLHKEYNDGLGLYFAQFKEEEKPGLRDDYSRGRFNTGNAEKYGFEISPDAYKIDGKLFSAIPAESLRIIKYESGEVTGKEYVESKIVKIEIFKSQVQMKTEI